MDIQRAGEEIENAVRAYLQKDELGRYKMDVTRQRPLLLIGPPGLGKTAIVAQAATHLKIGMLSYTMTHHTRQSVMGLPFIEEDELGGRIVSVTRYTMSEIVATIYRKVRESGNSEGILFLDEINCVSETLAPTMLMLLQSKTFGNEQIPPGWVIVSAGNPPEYNNSVHEFDVVTLDRLRRIDIEPSYKAFKKYALSKMVYPGIISYLNLKENNFYSIKTTVDGKRFVTARGWEDLSFLLYAYDQLKLKVDAKLISEYIQDDAIAQDFANYLELYSKYKTDYDVAKVISGDFFEVPAGYIENFVAQESSNGTPDEYGMSDSDFVKYTDEAKQQMGKLDYLMKNRTGLRIANSYLPLVHAPFDEKYGLIEIMVSTLIKIFNDTEVYDFAIKKIFNCIVMFKNTFEGQQTKGESYNQQGGALSVNSGIVNSDANSDALNSFMSSLQQGSGIHRPTPAGGANQQNMTAAQQAKADFLAERARRGGYAYNNSASGYGQSEQEQDNNSNSYTNKGFGFSKYGGNDVYGSGNDVYGGGNDVYGGGGSSYSGGNSKYASGYSMSSNYGGPGGDTGRGSAGKLDSNEYADSNPSGVIGTVYENVSALIEKQETMPLSDAEKTANAICLNFVKTLRSDFLATYPNLKVALDKIKAYFDTFKNRRQDAIRHGDYGIYFGYTFLETLYGMGNECILFTSDLAISNSAKKFFMNHGTGPGVAEYNRHYQKLMTDNGRAGLMQEANIYGN